MEENKELVQEQLEVNETIENMDEKTLANIVSDGLKYRFTKSFLVKQLPATMVEKTVPKNENVTPTPRALNAFPFLVMG